MEFHFLFSKHRKTQQEPVFRKTMSKGLWIIPCQQFLLALLLELFNLHLPLLFEQETHKEISGGIKYRSTAV